MPPVQTDTSRDPLASLRIQRRPEVRRSSVFGSLLRWLLILVVLAGMGVGGFLVANNRGLIGANAAWIPDALRQKPEVRVTRVTVETGRAADAVVVATGYIESVRQAKIGARAAGRIEVINVEEGSKVTQGQEIAVLEHKDIDAALAAMRASVLRAEAELREQDVEIERTRLDFERIKKLRQNNGTTEAEFDRSRFQHESAVARRESMAAAVKLAEARVLESEQMQENMIVRAPFDGTVISKDAEVGESILPGGMGEASGRGSVVTIADLQNLQVECDVKEDFISRVEEGLPAEIAVDAVPDRRYKGIVRKVIPMGDRARATIKVKVQFVDADARLFPEMSATVYFLTEPGDNPPEANTRRVFCDSQAIVTDALGSAVWIVGEEDALQRQSVTVGETRDNRTEILNGLTGGERVVLKPASELTAGTQVRIKE